MATNSSSPALRPSFSCSDSEGGIFMAIVFAIINFLLLLPLSLLVLHLSLQRWRRQRCHTAVSHSDVFAYHFAVMELIFVLGFAFYVCGKYFGPKELMMIGYCICTVFFSGQMCFQILTCVERYLAIVHPITYMGLRQPGGIRVRNVSIGCSWLLNCVWMVVGAFYYPSVPSTPVACCLVLALVVVSFCSVSALCVLIRPGPGDTGRDMTRLDQSKQRAFYTIAAITAVLWLYFLGTDVGVALSNLLSYSQGCLLLASGSWFGLPSSLVLPLLFLHRAGKLPCCHSNSG